ncbi:MAG: DNA alkylation response protein, partial [Paracoccaceae bacterium]
MTHPDPRADLYTHDVVNQPAARGDLDLWGDDPVLREAVAREGGQADCLSDYGRLLGSADMRAAGRDANRHVPELRQFDQGGRRLDEVQYHPSYHRFMAAGRGAGYSSIAWENGTGGHVTHAAMVYLASQVEPGHCCPLTMTYAAIPSLAASESLSAQW